MANRDKHLGTVIRKAQEWLRRKGIKNGVKNLKLLHFKKKTPVALGRAIIVEEAEIGRFWKIRYGEVYFQPTINRHAGAEEQLAFRLLEFYVKDKRIESWEKPEETFVV